MTEENLPNLSENDPLDINELASLNDEISTDFIAQLQNKISQEIGLTNDGALFEETQEESKPINLRFDDNIDDNFIKKYKAKLNKQQQLAKENEQQSEEASKKQTIPEDETDSQKGIVAQQQDPATDATTEKNTEAENTKSKKSKKASKQADLPQNLTVTTSANSEIETLTSGNIVEKPSTQEQIDYNESLDYLDGNVKYTKYVIYIDPENTEFINSLTVKERKNLINKILREQDNLEKTKKRFNFIQTVIKHSIVAIMTIAIFTPVIYFLINASLEASVNNYRRSQNMFKTLYKEKGKIQSSNINKYN